MNEIIVKQQNGSLDANFAEVKAQLKEQLDVYKTMVFTEDTKKIAKDTVAELRKGKKELGERCKEVKAEWMKPFDEFMEKANELAKMFDEPIDYINGQIDEFEKKRIEEKRKVISNIYAEMVIEEEIANLIPLSRIYNVKWENATFKEKDIREEIMSKKLALKEALTTIKAMNSGMEQRAIELFLVNFNLAESINLINEYEKQKAEILEKEREQMRKAEEERIRAEERRRIEEEQRTVALTEKAIEDAKIEVIDSFIPSDDGAEEKAYQYTMMLTPDAKEKVDMFLNSIGIEFFDMEVEE